jgi:hypothetical protein
MRDPGVFASYKYLGKCRQSKLTLLICIGTATCRFVSRRKGKEAIFSFYEFDVKDEPGKQFYRTPVLYNSPCNVDRNGNSGVGI